MHELALKEALRLLNNGLGSSIYELERHICRDAQSSYLYAQALCGRFKMGEPAISKDSALSYKYSTEILKRRFWDGEAVIEGSEYEEAYIKRFRLRKKEIKKIKYTNKPVKFFVLTPGLTPSDEDNRFLAEVTKNVQIRFKCRFTNASAKFKVGDTAIIDGFTHGPIVSIGFNSVSSISRHHTVLWENNVKIPVYTVSLYDFCVNNLNYNKNEFLL